MADLFTVEATTDFAKDLKRLIKKYSSLKEDLAELNGSLARNPIQGDALSKDCYKIRLRIKSKGAGKSGGGRVITCVRVVRSKIYLLALYDKSKVGSLSDEKITERLNAINDQ
jgi:mRNA-degrading endonuclease RelE of RelBE toxin-antitoxin system